MVLMSSGVLCRSITSLIGIFLPQVDVKEFRPDDAMNTFKMSGPHRFAVTGEDIRLFALGRSTALVLRIDTVRQLTVPTNRSFR